MDFTPSHRLRSRLSPGPTQDNLWQTLPVPVFVSVRRRSGTKLFARCAFEGFYEPEGMNGQRYIWTHGTAQMECHFAEPMKLRYVWLEVAGTCPDGTEVTVTWNGHVVVPTRRVRGRTTLCGKLPEGVVQQEVTLDLHTTTFVPDIVGLANGDQRELGIALRGVVFGKRWTKYRGGSHFRLPLRQRITRLTRRLRGRQAA